MNIYILNYYSYAMAKKYLKNPYNRENQKKTNVCQIVGFVSTGDCSPARLSNQEKRHKVDIKNDKIDIPKNTWME